MLSTLRKNTEMECNIKKPPTSDPPILTYKEFYEKNIILKKYKLPEIKKIVKHYKLRLTGNKDVLIQRIETHFKSMISATKIQKLYRGWIVKNSFKLRGKAFLERSICVNDTDFVTLEPLPEIPYELFFSYQDEKNFHYGFNITSLIQLMRTKSSVTNPYNREKLNYQTVFNIISLYNIVQIIYPEYKDEISVKLVVNKNTGVSRTNALTNGMNRTHAFSRLEFLANQQRRFNTGNYTTTMPENTLHSHNLRNTNNDFTGQISNNYFNPRVNHASMTPEVRNNYNKIIEIRKKPTSIRIQELFIEIDHLGNYTQSSWFTNLEKRDMLRLYRVLYDIWNFRAQLSIDIKLKICPLFDPFSSIFIQPIYQNNITEEQIKFVCLTIIENMVYSGVDEEFRKLGTLHALSALTIVSTPARMSMPWLYESISFL